MPTAHKENAACSGAQTHAMTAAFPLIAAGSVALLLTFFVPAAHHTPALSSSSTPIYFYDKGAEATGLITIAAAICGMAYSVAAKRSSKTFATLSGAVAVLSAAFLVLAGTGWLMNFSNRKEEIAKQGWWSWATQDAQAAAYTLHFAPFLLLGGAIAILFGLFVIWTSNARR